MTSQLVMTVPLAMLLLLASASAQLQQGAGQYRYAEPVPAAIADLMQPPPAFNDVINTPYQTQQAPMPAAASNVPAPYYEPAAAPVYETRQPESNQAYQVSEAERGDEAYRTTEDGYQRQPEGYHIPQAYNAYDYGEQPAQQMYYDDPGLQQAADTVKPSVEQPQTIYEEAVEYWTSNSCQYPPKDFYPMFKFSCDVLLDSIEFSPGLCYAFFNSTKQLCGMDLDEEEQKTLTSVTSLQDTVENDEICDTLYSLKQDDPLLFPQPQEEDIWFQRAYDILFSDKCKYACGLRGAHPICFGYFLSYEVMSGRGKVVSSTTPEALPPQQIAQPNLESATEVGSDVVPPVSSDLGLSASETLIPPPPLATEEEQQSQVEETNSESEEDTKQTKLNTTSKIFRPNPKLLLGQKLSLPEDYFYNYDDILLDENLSAEDLANYVPENEVDMLEQLDQVIDVLSGKEIPTTDEEKQEIEYISKNRDKLLERLNRIDGKLPTDPADPDLIGLDSPLYEDLLYGEGDKLDEDGKKWLELDDLDDLDDSWISFGPVMNVTSGTLMMNFLFLAIGILVLLALFVLFKASRRGYIRRIRLGRHGRNWNYERVQTNQPNEQEEYYEN